MYLGFVTFLTGLSVVLGTLFPLLAAAAFAIIADRVVYPLRGRRDAEEVRGSLRAYARGTRRWL